ncbi:MAG: BPL-N domain-containing protein [Nitrospirota bacterium]
MFGKIALYWDESYLWGLIALKTLRKLGVPVRLVTSGQVRAGMLGYYDLLIVPGGWASDKTAALGHEGRDAVREFVRNGGSYLGICGGAGFALDTRDGLGLVNVKRVPTAQRIPSFSGEIGLLPEQAAHPFWHGIRQPRLFHVWWPGQFDVIGEDVRIVARYGRPGPDFALADLPASEVSDWKKWEKKYEINLNPAALEGEPAVIEGHSGDGKIFLSYPHLETPGSRKGNKALLNVLEYLKPARRKAKKGTLKKDKKEYEISGEAVSAAREMMEAAEYFIAFGERNFLWYWRNDWTLQWRRGVRGVEYSTIYALTKELWRHVKAGHSAPDPDFNGKLVEARNEVLRFFGDARALLMKERFALMDGAMSAIRSNDPEVNNMRERLFSSSKRWGGEFKKVLMDLDELVFGII